MANVRDSDTSLWLHNKLGTSNDTWIGGSICSQLNVNVLRNIRECFVDLQTQVKLKLLLVFLHTPRRNLEEWRPEIEEILEVAALDLDQWVSMLAELLSTFPATGKLNTDSIQVEDNKKLFVDLIDELKALVNNSVDVDLLPMECQYLNKSALTSVVGHLAQPQKHFALRRKPKSAALKMELLQKSQETSAQLKKNVVPAVPTRSRGMPRKLDNATPLKGIPSRLPSGGFSNAARLSSSSAATITRTPAGRKEGRVKMLDIDEQPTGVAQLLAKKRRRQIVEEDDRDWPKKSKASVSDSLDDERMVATNGVTPTPTVAHPPPTPEYAASLLSHEHPPTPASVIQQTSPATPGFQNSSSSKPVAGQSTPGTTPVRHGVRVAMTPFRNTPANSSTTPSARQQQVISRSPLVNDTSLTTSPATPQSLTGPPISHQQSSSMYQATSNEQHVQHVDNQQQPQTDSQQQKVTIIAQPAENPRRNLALTRDQMRDALDMFSTANKVTRPEKALILGFIAGSRENPCPHLGNVVTIKLSESKEMVMQEDGSCVAMMTEIHFQMNYSSGEWRQVKKYCGLADPSVM